MKQLENLIKKCQFAMDDKISEANIRYLFRNDPTPNKNMAKFMCYMYINTPNSSSFEVIFEIKNTFDKYWELGKLKDKYNFKLEPLDKIVKEYSFDKFRQYIGNIENEINRKIQLKNQNKVKSTEYKILDENSEWVAIEPLTFEASKQWGNDSDWCTTKTQAYFNQYSNKENKLVIFIHKPTQKYYSENPTESKNRDPEYKFQAQIPKKNLKVKNKVFIKSKSFLNLFDNESKQYPDFDKFLKEINIDSNKLTDSYKIQTNLNEIIEFQNIPEDEYYLLFKIYDPKLNKQTGLIDCDNIDWDNLNLTRLPQTIKLGVVNGDFSCHNNKLISLEGCPEEVGGSFRCGYNKLTSLKGCPEKIGEGFYCYHNQLTSLKGCPKEINGGFYCHHNYLTSLEGCPEKIDGSFYCSYNKKQFTIKEVKKYCNVDVGRIII